MATLNREARLALVTRATEMVAMAAGLVLAMAVLTPLEQGWFVAFMSANGLLALFDFGLSYAALQTTTLRAARDDASLASVARLISRLAALLVIAGVLTVGMSGLLLLDTGSEPDWRAPWLAYLVASAVAQWYMPRLAVHEGGVSVVGAWRIRLWQEIASGILLIGGLWVGWGLWALAASAVGRIIVALIALPRSPFLSAGRVTDEMTFGWRNWRTEVWPFQWKIGLSSLAGFAIFRSLTLIVLAAHGAEEAGRFGLSLAAMNMLITVGTAWPMSQVSRYGVLMVAGRISDLLHAARATFFASSSLVLVLGALFCVAQYWAAMHDWPLASRLGDWPINVCLMATALVHHGVACHAVILRIEQRDPLLPVSVGGGIAVVAVISLVAYEGTLAEVALANFLVSMAGIPFVWLFMRGFRMAHAQSLQHSLPGKS